VEQEGWPVGLTHDLNNQLSIILGFCELLLESTPDEDPRRTDILEIDKAARMATSLVSAIFSEQP
jgi:two-component system cell cycle sensor histidine kinase/response regulator CckA